MAKKLLTILSACVICLGLSSTALASGVTGPKNCSDFKTWKEAQDYYESHDPENDPSKLDGNDKDGIVCESLPGFDSSYQPAFKKNDKDTSDNKKDDTSKQSSTSSQNKSNNNQSNNSTQKSGGEMPKTASNYLGQAFFGALIAMFGIIGGVFAFFLRKKSYN